MVGLAITLGTASVLQDIAMFHGRIGSNGFEVGQIPKDATPPSR